jgi:YidC/Oxa1 family membrane protein insertase
VLDFIYWPVSFILWCWHKVFGYVFGPDNGLAWALAIVFLVFTLRALLLKPAISQVKSMRKMQEFQPQIKALQKKYANDKQRQAQEMQKLQREHGFNPIGGCLPVVFQIPVFIGLNHVLRNFNPHFGSNYFFPKSDITSYLHADLFGAHLGDAMWGLGLLGQAGVHPGWHWNVAPLAIPLMIIASIATHFTARISVRRQRAMGNTGGQADMMNKLSLWIFPLGVLTFGAGLLVGLLLYWVSNNGWTLGQQHFVFQRMDREEQKKKAEAVEARQSLAPKPGQKPKKNKQQNPAAPSNESTVDGAEGEKSNDAKEDKTNGATKPATTGDSKAGSNGNGALTSGSVPGIITDRNRKKKRNRK